MALLKASSKKIQGSKTRKKIPLLGTIDEYKESKKLQTENKSVIANLLAPNPNLGATQKKKESNVNMKDDA